jgi:general stress protein CsbA
VCYLYKDRNKYTARILPVALALIMAVMSAFLWEGYHSLFFVVGITLNTLAMGYFNPQNLRKSILLTSSLILIYNLLMPIPSIGGSINELVAISSSVIGLICHRTKKKP